MKHTLLANTIVFLLVAAGGAFATTASRQEAQLAARKLLRPDESVVPADIWTVSTLVATGDTVGYIVKAGDAGWAIVPSLKELGPVAAYSRSSVLPRSAEDPMLLTIAGRLRRAAVAFTTNVGASGGNGNSIYREQYAANLARWDLPGSAEKVDAVTVGPLLNSYWGQRWPYNERCPVILGSDHAPAGCVPVAVGQILNYWRHPVSGVGSERYWWPGGFEYLEAHFYDPYDWSHVYPSYISGDPQEAIDAISELIYEVGVSVNADYGAYATSAATERVPNSLHAFLGLPDFVWVRSTSHDLPTPAG